MTARLPALALLLVACRAADRPRVVPSAKRLSSESRGDWFSHAEFVRAADARIYERAARAMLPPRAREPPLVPELRDHRWHRNDAPGAEDVRANGSVTRGDPMTKASSQSSVSNLISIERTRFVRAGVAPHNGRNRLTCDGRESRCARIAVASRDDRNRLTRRYRNHRLTRATAASSRASRSR